MMTSLGPERCHLPLAPSIKRASKFYSPVRSSHPRVIHTRDLGAQSRTTLPGSRYWTGTFGDPPRTGRTGWRGGDRGCCLAAGAARARSMSSRCLRRCSARRNPEANPQLGALADLVPGSAFRAALPPCRPSTARPASCRLVGEDPRRTSREHPASPRPSWTPGARCRSPQQGGRQSGTSRDRRPDAGDPVDGPQRGG